MKMKDNELFTEGAYSTFIYTVWSNKSESCTSALHTLDNKN